MDKALNLTRSTVKSIITKCGGNRHYCDQATLTDYLGKTGDFLKVSKSPVKELQSSLAEIVEPVQTSTSSALYRSDLYRRASHSVWKKILWSDEIKVEPFGLKPKYDVWCKLNTAQHQVTPSILVSCSIVTLQQEEPESLFPSQVT